MARDFAKSFYRSRTWRKCQQAYVKQAGGLCERCLERGIFRAGVIVHHKNHVTPETITDSNVLLNPDNLQLLCRDCHALMHKPEKRYKVDELGRIIVL